MGIRLFKELDSYPYLPKTLFYINSYKTFFVRICKKVRGISNEIWKRIRFHNGSLKSDPCPYLVKYSPDVLMKTTKCLDILNAAKKCLIKIKTESSP